MSKSPDILLPAIGATCLVLGAAFAFATAQYRQDEVASLRTQAALAKDEIGALGGRIEEMAAEAEAASGAAAGDPDPGFAPLRIGRAALPEEVAAWDIDVRPDGAGLPEGRGGVLEGEEVFAEACASCHGDFGEAVDRWPVLAGGQGTLSEERPVKTIGSYWPYLSTVFDYVNRAMPFGEAQSLEPDEVYAITAYLLYLNDLVDEGFTLDSGNFAGIRLPNEGAFRPDDRAETELAAFSAEPCMRDCKDAVEITARARVLDVTPDEAGGAAQAGEALASAPARAGTGGAGGDASGDALAAAGEKAYGKCKACHQVGPGARNRTGPHLNGIVGRPAGGLDGFRYSSAMAKAGDGGLVWTDETIAAFIASPRTYVKGTKMSFKGMADDADVRAVIAFIKARSE